MPAESGLSTAKPAGPQWTVRKFYPGRPLPGITAGLVAGLLILPIEISFGALIFSGPLSGYASRGIGLALFGGLVISLVVALTSSYRAMVAVPQDSPVAILAIMAGAIAARMPSRATPQDTFHTVVVAIALTTFLAGTLFLVLGQCRLGALIRYIPYPVVGGFLAGTGGLLVRGALGFLTGKSLTLVHLPILFHLPSLLDWLPALLLALLLLVISRRPTHFLAMPALLLAAVAVFYMLLWLTGTTVAEAGAQGWLLEPFPEATLWRPLAPGDLKSVYWPAILGQAGNIVTILFISTIALLLNTSGLELTVRKDIDLNRELQGAGWANIAAAIGGSLPGYQALSLSALGHRMTANSRLVGTTTALLFGAVLFFGAPLLSLLPKPVLGSLLLFLGLAFLLEWLYDAWFKLAPAEYGIVVLILVVIMAAGVLAGLGVGLVLSLLLFVVNYSRVRVVKHTLSGANYSSNVDRPRRQRRILRQRGHWLYIMELQGFIFFATASSVLDRVRARIANPGLPPPRFVLIDFRAVNGLDASAVLSFARLTQLAQAHQIALVFTHLSEKAQRQLSRELLKDDDGKACRTEPDLDHGAEWCEEQILRLAAAEVAGAATTTDREDGMSDGPWLEVQPPATAFAELMRGLSGDAGGQRASDGDGTASTARLTQYVERRQVPEGHVLIQQGDEPSGLYFLEAGQVSAERQCKDGRVVRLRKMGSGTIVGEMGQYLGAKASASVLTNQPSIVHFLSAAALRRMEVEAPEIAVAFHRYIAQLLSERLSRANDTLQALLSEPDPCPDPDMVDNNAA